MKRDPKTIAPEQPVRGVKATLRYLPGHAPVRGENTCPGFDERMSVPVSGVIAETLMPEFGKRIVREWSWQGGDIKGSGRVIWVAVRFFGPDSSSYNEVLAICGEKLVVTSLKTVISEVFGHVLPTSRECVRLNLFLAGIMLEFEIKPR